MVTIIDDATTGPNLVHVVVEAVRRHRHHSNDLAAAEGALAERERETFRCRPQLQNGIVWSK